MRGRAFLLAFGGFAAALAAPAAAQLAPYKTSECFAFWRLKEKLETDGVGEIVATGPQGPDGGIPAAQMERVALYLDLEEKLRFRCPDFAPPPDRSPGERQPPGQPPVTTAKPDEAAPAVAPQPQSGPPLPIRRPPKP